MKPVPKARSRSSKREIATINIVMIRTSSIFIFGVVIVLSLSISLSISISASAHAQGAYSVRAYRHQMCPADPENQDVRLSALSGFAVGPKFSAVASPTEPLLRPFTSDGCSSSPDKLPFMNILSNYVSCCVDHDVAYWMGGTRQQKTAADDELEKCIAKKDLLKTSKVYKFFVQKFGGPDSSQTYRWGYGWNYRRPYRELSSDENQQIVSLYGVGLEKIRETLLASDFPLLKLCNTYDPVFYGFSDDEKAAYRLLNASLKHDDVIEWAKWDYFNLEKREFQVKLKNCPTPAVITFLKDGSPKLRSDCL